MAAPACTSHELALDDIAEPSLCSGFEAYEAGKGEHCCESSRLCTPALYPLLVWTFACNIIELMGPYHVHSALQRSDDKGMLPWLGV
ncbi:hypothetical protein EYF80_034649 [Liparis tanakae]|uniref:Uncharacterized protein n=1 Tax=Liparis tanakae TaxID=230148 RepID=A0A4Z2GPU2_9TELE|nr:hypothetical protein EYF80_034649 [Liparis tanakae]